MLSRTYSRGVPAIARISTIGRIPAMSASRRFSSGSSDDDVQGLGDSPTPGLGSKDRDTAGRVTTLEHAVQDIRTDVKDIRTDVREIRTEMKSGFVQATAEQQKMLSQFAAEQQRTFTQFYVRVLFALVGVSAVLVNSALIMPKTEASRIDNEIRRRALIRAGVDEAMKAEAMKGMAQK